MRVCSACESLLLSEKRSNKAASKPRATTASKVVMAREALCVIAAGLCHNRKDREMAANPAIRPAAPLNICKEPLLTCGSGGVMVIVNSLKVRCE